MIDVLLATYRPNERFLEAQVSSIRAQEGVDVNLVVREDAEGEGARANFAKLLDMSKSEYVAFADQDDVWRKDKLAKCLARMRALEETHGIETPALVFCDSQVADAGLKVQCSSFVHGRVGDVGCAVRFPRMLMQNFIPGHAMLFNAALRAKAGKIPGEAIMHDYWVALVAAAFGNISFVDEPLVKYRQHGGNVLSSESRRMGFGDFRARLMANVRQARAFAERFGGECPPCCMALSEIGGRSWLGRRRTLLKHGLFKAGCTRNIMLFAAI